MRGKWQINHPIRILNALEKLYYMNVRINCTNFRYFSNGHLYCMRVLCNAFHIWRTQHQRENTKLKNKRTHQRTDNNEKRNKIEKAQRVHL